jgi:HPt (histidine-containing phosphotransfer) domain-containing protein
MAEQLLAVFADTTPALLDRLRDAAEGADTGAAGRLVHELKGSCQTMGAVGMVAVCDALRDGRMDPLTAVAELEALLTPTVDGIRDMITAAPHG